MHGRILSTALALTLFFATGATARADLMETVGTGLKKVGAGAVNLFNKGKDAVVSLFGGGADPEKIPYLLKKLAETQAALREKQELLLSVYGTSSAVSGTASSAKPIPDAYLQERANDLAAAYEDNQKNFDELAQVRELLIEAGLKRWRLFTIFPKGRAKDNPLLDVTNDQFRHLMDFIQQTRKEGRIAASYSCEGFLGSYEGKVRDSFFWCRAGINVGSVLADGSISACPSLRGDYIQGNIYKESFVDVWNNRFQVMRDRGWTKTGPCADCDAYPWCEGNGLHLRDEKTGHLLRCHYHMLTGGMAHR